jgi:hypothetical protein
MRASTTAIVRYCEPCFAEKTKKSPKVSSSGFCHDDHRQGDEDTSAARLAGGTNKKLTCRLGVDEAKAKLTIEIIIIVFTIIIISDNNCHEIGCWAVNIKKKEKIVLI